MAQIAMDQVASVGPVVAASTRSPAEEHLLAVTQAEIRVRPDEERRVHEQVGRMPLNDAEKAAMAARVNLLICLYREPDTRPWLVGFSGGKDSCATLQLAWMAVAAVDPAERTRPIHVISTDTGVENPVMAAWVSQSLQGIRDAAAERHLPITATALAVQPSQAFLVQLIGRGYATAQ